MADDELEQGLVINFLQLRKLIGMLGVVMPFILAIGTFLFCNCTEFLDSISAYYHTPMRNVFVGILCAIGIFFLSYRGYDKQDYIANKIAGTLALGIAFFPTASYRSIQQINSENLVEALLACQVPEFRDRDWVNTSHLIIAALFFLTLIYITWFLFTKTDQVVMSPEKQKRNLIYRCTAIIMLACLVLIAVYFLWLRSTFPFLEDYNPVFWLESLALVAFGTAWATKGQMILDDE